MIAFISDIHGNYPALQAVLHEIDRMKCDQIICLGDVTGYYSQVNECIALLRQRGIPCLLGNHDYYLISNTCCSSKTVRLCLDYQKTVISEDNLNWLRGNPPFVDTAEFSLRHAGWHDAIEERFDRFDFSWVDAMPQQAFFSGHTHVQGMYLSVSMDRVYCNPGSVGQPRDNDPRAAFAVWIGGCKVSLHRVPYDIDEVVRHMQTAGLGDWIWKGLYTGRQIGK